MSFVNMILPNTEAWVKCANYVLALYTVLYLPNERNERWLKRFAQYRTLAIEKIIVHHGHILCP